jgi:hypothetical protein
MRQRRKVLLCTLAGLLIVFAVASVMTPRQHTDYGPVYHGLTLAQWLDVVNQHRANGYFTTFQEGRPPSRTATPLELKEAEEAVHAIGTNALPTLLAWLSWEPGNAKRLYLSTIMRTGLPERIESRAVSAAGRRQEDLAEMAIDGLRILHTNAIAFETLSKLATDTNHPDVWAIKAFSAVTNQSGL